jgi:hypothetical protein
MVSLMFCCATCTETRRQNIKLTISPPHHLTIAVLCSADAVLALFA